jgi:hypothetical protein
MRHTRRQLLASVSFFCAWIGLSRQAAAQTPPPPVSDIPGSPSARRPESRPISRVLTPPWRSRNRCRNCRMLSSRFAGITISSSIIDG